MHLYKKIFLTISILISTNLMSEYEITINYESGFEFKSQKELLSILQKETSRRGIEKIIKNQEWIKDYSLIYKPFEKKIFISIRNRTPFFIFNKEYFYDENLNSFKFDETEKKLIMVNGDIDNLNNIIILIDLIHSNKSIEYKIESINYNFVSGWDVQTEKTLIRFGKDISEQKLKSFKDTANYLFEIRKIPSIIDMRHKDGVALNYGK
tara:strand:+ start:4519 stop:5145 length:627 start_codon:yes stop_codon:yes gene_type:complete